MGVEAKAVLTFTVSKVSHANDIVSDSKTKQMIETYNEQMLDGPFVRCDSCSCDLCSAFCHQCRKYLCRKCELGHSKVSAQCRATDLVEVTGEIEERLRKLLKQQVLTAAIRAKNHRTKISK